MAKKRNNDKPEIRCAIYTRKSTEEGLEKEFNTLDAQRESGEAYINSQKNEGWICLPDKYDDGGFTGGNMDRPALKRLLEDVKEGKVNCIVVYKIDRLSRSLMDFSKIVDILDQHGTSFVSVTQHFNTKDSMGRLTLNILLSFAQFEREIISERTRDKIAASRRKGKWTGGIPVLGYDVDKDISKLIINNSEADRVRHIFNLYLEKKSLRDVGRELESLGWKSKTWITKRGKNYGGVIYNKQRLSHMLNNVIYIGKITYKDEIHEGEHEAIIDNDTWQEVQAQLKSGDRSADQRPNKHKALLRGLMHCSACNKQMIHIPVAKKNNKIYRYYTCLNAHNNGWDKCPSPSIPATEIESFVLERLTDIGSDERLMKATLIQVGELHNEQIKNMRRELSRIELHYRALKNKPEEANRGELRTAKSELQNMKENIKNAENEQITANDCEDAVGRFEALWNCLKIDEQTALLKLIFERIDYDGVSGKISFRLQDNGLIKTAVA